MISITNETDRLRAYRVRGTLTVWIPPRGRIVVDAPLPPVQRVKAFARGGLRLRETREAASVPTGAPHEGGVVGTDPPRRETAPAAALPARTGPPTMPDLVKIPADWQKMPWLVRRALAAELLSAGGKHGTVPRTSAGVSSVIEAELRARQERGEYFWNPDGDGEP